MKRDRQQGLKKAMSELDNTGSLPDYIQDKSISQDLSINEQILRGIFENCSDVVFRVVQIHDNAKILMVYIDGMADTKTVDTVLLKPLLYEASLNRLETMGQILEEQLVAVAQVKTATIVKELLQGILKANFAIFVDGEDKALLAELKGFEKRSVEEPNTETILRGPRDAFTETLRVNTSLVRRRIYSARLKMEAFTIGKITQTDVVLAYIEGVASTTLLEEIRRRLARIQIDGILESGYIEELIVDSPFSPFPQVQNTERPDVVCGSLLEGKAAILVDNTPFALIAPMTFWSGLQAAEDYYERFFYATFMRLLRFILFNVSFLFPSLYVAIVTYHARLIPTNLLVSIASAREGVPFPTIVETFLMELMFEGLREAGVRLPKPIGSSVSIIGGLVIGEAIVQAGIVSAPIVIVVAITGIASFAIPRYNFGTVFRLLRFPMLLLAGVLGLYGVAIGAIAVLIHLTHLRSFGMPYLTPFSPRTRDVLKDDFIRTPWWNRRFRPAFVSGADKSRLLKGRKSGPERGR